MNERIAPDEIPAEALLADRPPVIGAVTHGLRTLVREAVPEALERVRPGWGVIGYDVPVGRRTAFFAWIWPQPEHVHLGFPKGVLLDDPEGALAGEGITKQARWFTLTSTEELADARLGRFTRAAADLAVMRAGTSSAGH